MPYYCTVPRCTSMAGKAKNVSFHQFPRDEELAKLWNKILKRGKPYTKYSKVCSLHFRPEDYTITSVGKNKGQWRTLRKDAIPTQNLPTESPVPAQRSASSGAWVPNNVPSNVMDPTMQHQIAQAIYLQTMIAMQAAANGPPQSPNIGLNSAKTAMNLSTGHSSNIKLSEIEQVLQKQTLNNDKKNGHRNYNNEEGHKELLQTQNQDRSTSFKCLECSKCFKDPDVFILHKRTHTKTQDQPEARNNEKENYNANDVTGQDTLKANPILANLLKSGISNTPVPSFYDNSILNVESQIMAALVTNMENYLRNLSSNDSRSNSQIQNNFHNEEAEEYSDHSQSSDVNDSSNSSVDSHNIHKHTIEEYNTIGKHNLNLQNVKTENDHDHINSNNITDENKQNSENHTNINYNNDDSAHNPNDNQNQNIIGNECKKEISSNVGQNIIEHGQNIICDHNIVEGQNIRRSNRQIENDEIIPECDQNILGDQIIPESFRDSSEAGQNILEDDQNIKGGGNIPKSDKIIKGDRDIPEGGQNSPEYLDTMKNRPNCDNEDLNDSDNLVIDENV